MYQNHISFRSQVLLREVDLSLIVMLRTFCNSDKYISLDMKLFITSSLSSLQLLLREPLA